jgi:hypothetical protein
MSKSVASGCFGIGTSDCIQEFFVITLIKNTQLRRAPRQSPSGWTWHPCSEQKTYKQRQWGAKKGRAMLATIESEDKRQIFRQQLWYG